MSAESPNEAAAPETQAAISSIDVVGLPWVFTQHQPLSSDDFIRSAKDRGVELDNLKLRQLYRRGILVPFVVITAHRSAELRSVELSEEPQQGGTWLRELRHARATGRLLDLNDKPFQSRLRFTPPKPYMSGWWNGLIYSHHQLSILPRLGNYLAHATYTYRNERLYPHLPEPDPFLLHRAGWQHRMALMAAALEARYLPVLDPEWLRLVNAGRDEYERYRQAFDAVAMSVTLRYSADQARKDAEELLLIAHSIEPTDGPWSQLLRHAPRDSWKHLKDASLSAMDLRETAEILLRFYEDLAARGAAKPLPDIPGYGWHPLHERLSKRERTLDQELMSLGISPHPRVVLAVEGESEEKHAPRVWRKLGYPAAPELVRFMKLGGSDNDPVRVAALAITPLVTKLAESGDFWWVNKPPTRFMVAADPENRYAPNRIAQTRSDILAEVRAGLKAQGASASEDELNELVELRTWSESCYEYEHFTDEELADGIAKVHRTCNGWSRSKLIDVLRYWRAERADIKRVWMSGEWDAQLNTSSGRWASKVSKTELAEVMWPVLEQEIERAMNDPDVPVPAIAEVIQDAFLTAQNWRYKSFVLTAAKQIKAADTGGQSDDGGPTGN